MVYKGKINARIVDVRFASSGKIVKINKFTGDLVKKGNLIASIDRKNYQTTLDRELADYEKVRADFEIFAQKNPDPQDATTKYLKTEKQSSLDASVKSVELAKANLDQCDSFSPVNGIVIDDSNVVNGINITPASSSIKIVDTDSYYFEFEIKQTEVHKFAKPVKCKINIKPIGKTISSETMPVLSTGKAFLVRVPIQNSDEILMGLTGECRV